MRAVIIYRPITDDLTINIQLATTVSCNGGYDNLVHNAKALVFSTDKVKFNLEHITHIAVDQIIILQGASYTL